MKEIVTAGNWPSWAIDRGSLCVCTWVKALSGTGVWGAAAELPVPPPPPAGAEDEDPPAALVADARVVPPDEVLALLKVLPEELAVLRTVAAVEAFEIDESVEVEFTVDVAEVVLVLPATRADVDEAGDETPAVEDAVNSALPEDGVAPEPAPDEDPAVLDVVDVELLVDEDWI